MSQNIILSNQQIEFKIRRIAYQIYESFINEEAVVIAGIIGNGFILAEKIATELRNISVINVIICEVFIDKKNPMNNVSTSLESSAYENKGLILVDDVLNSGATLIYGVKHFLNVNLKSFKTAVLVDRNHKKFPIKADFKGLSLSTSLSENIQVVFNEANNYAYLE